MKVLLHVDEAEKWKLALGNAKNLLKYGEEFGKEYVVEILANSAAVTSLTQARAKEEGLFADMEDLAIQAVAFVACRNALKANSIMEGSLIPFVEVVPAGIAEIVDKQEDGYAYVKP
ncbi:DsrE family protein [Christensenella timonensis]|uniref:DsrE family protein n=1 Tax=Christensenella timonensis TaxID=1816678 RepID=UPI000836A4CD|nr:DsrE family protein [Christensenella timonensis]